MKDTLPDSRAREPKGLVWSPQGWMVPIFCANCGKEGGVVTQEHCTYAFWLCDLCFERCGKLTGMLVVPDSVFWEKVRNEQLEAFGRLLSHEEMERVVREDSTPLATLIKEGR